MLVTAIRGTCHLNLVFAFSVFMHMCGGPRLMSGTVLYHSSTLFVEADSHNQTQSSPMWLVSLASLLWRFRLHLLSLELQEGCHPHSGIYMDSGDLNLGLHIFVARAFTTEPISTAPKTCLLICRDTWPCRRTHGGGLYWIAILYIFNTEGCGTGVPARLPQSRPWLLLNHFLPNSLQFTSHSEVASQLSIGHRVFSAS